MTTIEAPRGRTVTNQTPLELVERVVRDNAAKVDNRLDHVVIATFQTPVVERGTPLVIHYWQVVQPIPPRHARSALFSFTFLAENAGQATVDLAWIDREVRASTFYPTLGVTPPKRRWRLPWAR